MVLANVSLSKILVVLSKLRSLTVLSTKLLLRLFRRFDFVVPTELPGVDPNILDPRDTYECACKWEEKAKDLAGRFIKNFAKFTGNEAGKALVAAGPKL